jgi:hypothetical protein
MTLHLDEWYQNEIVNQKAQALKGTYGWCRPQNRNLRWPLPDTILRLQARRERLLRVGQRWPHLWRQSVERRREVEAELRARRPIAVPRALVWLNPADRALVAVASRAPEPTPVPALAAPTVLLLPPIPEPFAELRRFARCFRTLMAQHNGAVWRNSAPRGWGVGIFVVGTLAHHFNVTLSVGGIMLTEYQLYKITSEQRFWVCIDDLALIVLLDRLVQRYRNQRRGVTAKPPRMTEQRRFLEDLGKELARMPVGVLSVRHTLDGSIIESERGGRLVVHVTPTGTWIDSLAHYAFVPVDEGWMRDVVTRAVARQNATACCGSFRQGIPAATAH